MFPYMGVQFRACEWMTERRQVLFSLRKRKRVVKKFARNPKNWATVPSEKVVFINGAYHAHPAIVQRLKEQCKPI